MRTEQAEGRHQHSSRLLDAAAVEARSIDDLRRAADAARANSGSAPRRRCSEADARRRRVMLIGEQPGDKEDRSGQPFVGPAGRVLDRALAAAGIDRRHVYVTNVVKHFSWEERGKWRIHKKPKPHQIQACRPWLDAEIAALRPNVIVCLGATAAQALLGRDFRVSRDRGRFVPAGFARHVLAIVHPSSILRADDEESRHQAFEQFVADLRVAARVRSTPTRRAGSADQRGAPTSRRRISCMGS